MNFWEKLRSRPRLAAKICWTLSMLSFALVAAGLITDSKPLMISSLVLLALFMVVLPKALWRCPYCGESLPTRGMLQTRKCPYCGKELP